MIRKRLKKNFWCPTPERSDSNLYEDELGWREANRADAHATDSWNIFKFYLGHYGFDLALYLVQDDTFYYIDNIQNNEVLKLKDRVDWDGQYIMERVELTSFPEIEPETVYEYKDIDDLWRNIEINGLSLKEIIDKSVVFLIH